MKKRIMALMVILSISLTVFAGCEEYPMEEKSSDEIQAQVSEKANKQALRTVGEPKILNFTEKKLVKKLYEMRDDPELICYAYVINKEGKHVYLYRTFGFGINASIQFSNPQKRIDNKFDYGSKSDHYLGDHIMPQAEPNNLFMPEGLAATYLMAIDDITGKTKVIYAEPEIVVSEVKLPPRLVADWSMPSNYLDEDY